MAVAPICSVDQLPESSETENISVKRRCERYSWHTLARELLGDPEAQFTYNQVGAPQIVGSSLSLSVSHSQHLVAVVISPKLAAVDIELKGRNFAKVASRYFSERESQLLTASENLLAQVWSIKETAYKYAGRKELRLLEDICVESIVGEVFMVKIAGEDPLSGCITDLLDHTLSYVG